MPIYQSSKQYTVVYNNPTSPDKAGFVTSNAGPSVPSGWLACDGSAVSRATYSQLFSVIGVTYGSGDGVNTFNLPNLPNTALSNYNIIKAYSDEMTGNSISITPASTTLTGTVSTSAQTFAGVKTFQDGISNTAISGASLSNASLTSPSLTSATLNGYYLASGTATISLGTLTPAANKSLQLISAAGDFSMIASPSAGQQYVIVNESSTDINVANLAGGVAGNQIYTGTGATVVFKAKSAISIVYDGGLSKWVLTGASGSAAAGANSDITSLSGLTTPLSGSQGGTGVSNTGKTITLGGNLTTSGAFNTTLTTTGTTNITLPTSGTLISSTDTGTVTSAMIQDGTIVNGDISATAAITYSKLSLTNSITNTDISSSAAIADSKLATISTSGKVSNSATTATNLNTASAIVARDASGNFSAGTITAALTGNASTASDLASGSILASAKGGTGINNAGSLTYGANNITLTTSGATSLTLPTSGTVATTSNALSAFASTTSAGLAGVISDETGSGSLVFGTGPTLSAPVLDQELFTEGAAPSTPTAGKLAMYAKTDHKVYVKDSTGTETAVGAGVSNLSGLTDVTISTPLSKQGLLYNSSTSKWENSFTAYSEETASADVTGLLTPTTGRTIQRLTSSPTGVVSRIANPSDGKLIIIINDNASTITISNDSGFSDSILTGTGASVVLTGYRCATAFVYNTTLSRWIMIGAIPNASVTATGLVSIGTQTFNGTKTFSGGITSTGLTGSTFNGYSLGSGSATISFGTLTPASNKSLQLISAAGDFSMIASPSGGQQYVIVNESATDITISNLSGATAANQIYTGTNTPITFKAKSAISVIYDSTLSKWLITSGTGSSTFNLATEKKPYGKTQSYLTKARSGQFKRQYAASAVSTWTSRANTAIPGNTFYSVCWAPELGLFVAVAGNGTGNRVMTSPDGITWTSRTSAADLVWSSVCWAPELGLFCAVAASGTSNRVMTSPDGITWTSRTSAADNGWQSVCWASEIGLFVAVASSSATAGTKIMTSPDGINWTLRSYPIDPVWNSVCWSAELSLFVVVGVSGNVITSSDGITWTSRTAASNSFWGGVCWSSELGLFCAVGYSGVLMTSPDGITWTSRTAATNNDWWAICWSAELGLFVAASQSGTGNRVMTSSDGITWTSRTSATDLNWYSICWAPELGTFCAVANNGTSSNSIMTASIVSSMVGLNLNEGSTLSTPASGNLTLYAKTDHKLYTKDSTGAELVVGGLNPSALSTTLSAAIAGTHYLTNTSGGAFTVTLPSGAAGSVIRFSDVNESWDLNQLTIAPASGQKIDNLATDETLICDIKRGWVELSWNSALSSWSLQMISSTTDSGTTNYNYSAQTGNYNITSRDCCVSVSGSSAYTVTLPTAVGISGKVYVIKSNMSTGILLTVATTSSQTIDGVTTKSLARFDALKVISNGSNWEII